MKSSVLFAIPIAGGCCPSGTTGAAGSSYYVETDLGAGADDAGCARLCLAAASQQYRVVGGVESCTARLVDAGVQEVTCRFPVDTCLGGRRPAGFDAIALSAHEAVGAWLARTAALEAASVLAVRILATELSAHGSPRLLSDAALRCAKQELRHAAAMNRLARRFDAAALPIEITMRPVRSLEEIALENAVEGGVREAFGARVAVEQARRAQDREVRVVFATIAPEESGHARLSAAVHEWAVEKLSPTARRRIIEACDRARQQLKSDLEVEVAATLRSVLGLPDATRAQDIANTM